jgi:hypothetical protein
MDIEPIPISQGKSFFLTRSKLGRKIRIPPNKSRVVAKSLQNAKPIGERPLRRMRIYIRIPEVDQQKEAAITRRIQVSLPVLNRLKVWVTVSLL